MLKGHGITPTRQARHPAAQHITHMQQVNSPQGRSPEQVPSRAVALGSQLEELHLNQVGSTLAPLQWVVAEAALGCTCQAATQHTGDMTAEAQAAQEVVEGRTPLAVAVKDDTEVLGTGERHIPAQKCAWTAGDDYDVQQRGFQGVHSARVRQVWLHSCWVFAQVAG